MGEEVFLGPGREFDLIRRLLEAGGDFPAEVQVGPGDDCLVLGGGMVLSVDLSVEGVHFRREWLSIREAGYRATAGALSDLAAMAAEPLGILLSMGLPRAEADSVAEALQAGADEACRREGIRVLGGDLSGSPGPILLDVIVLGKAEEPLRRRGGRVGDEIWVTGWVGGAAAAVHLLVQGREPPARLRGRFVSPAPRIREVRWLQRRAPLTAGIDLSDGLAGDVGHLAAASGEKFVVDEEKIPLDPGMEGVIPDPADRLHFGLRGGEDYEVCLLAPPGELDGLAREFRETFGIPLTRIGRVEEGEGAHLKDRNGTLRSLDGGFDHFLEQEKEQE